MNYLGCLLTINLLYFAACDVNSIICSMFILKYSNTLVGFVELEFVSVAKLSTVHGCEN